MMHGGEAMVQALLQPGLLWLMLAVWINGRSSEESRIHNNWFFHPEPGPAVVRPWPPGGDTNLQCANNAYGATNPSVKD